MFSQWYPSKFVVDGVEYSCAEQYMMQQKAVLMNDMETADIIMALDEPNEMKQYGRYVKNFNQTVWDQHCKPLTANDSVLDPPDADHLFSAKVMLMSCPNLEDLYHKSCALAEDPHEVQEGFVHPTRLIHFLVGLKGKNETMAIGGPWSPSLDGANPRDDPQVLIRTAIRTTKALTGIDLTRCTQWYQFAEVRYLRQEEMHKGKLVPARVETTVIFLPDVWSCNPTRLEWATLQAAYKKQLQKK